MRHVLRRLSAAGDTILAAWDVENEEEVARAKAAVEALIAEGTAVFSTGEGQAATKIREFDPRAEELIAVSPLVGG